MSDSGIHKPVIFFGKRVYFLFAAVMSVPVWLACSAYIDAMNVHDEEAVATGITMCFFAALFTGRQVADIGQLHLRFKTNKLIQGVVVFVIACLCWMFFNARLPVEGRSALRLFAFWVPFVAVGFVTGVLIKTVRAAMEKELKDAQSTAAKSESELRLLQSQLSPHFLFNTLNNMYGLSLTQHEKVPSLLLKLSDLLRYSVYEANELFVPLKNEIGYINNYIEFEKIRLGERLNLKMDIETPQGDEPKIASMLLIVFIENAFKHSKNTVDEKIFIDIDLRTWNDLILFSIKNSHKKQETRFDKNSGFGLDNVRKRLELLYPGMHTLDIVETDRSYAVALQVKMKS